MGAFFIVQVWIFLIFFLLLVRNLTIFVLYLNDETLTGPNPKSKSFHKKMIRAEFCMQLDYMGQSTICSKPDSTRPVLLRQSPVSQWTALHNWNPPFKIALHLPTLYNVKSAKENTILYWQNNKPIQTKRPFDLINISTLEFWNQVSNNKQKTLYYSHQIRHSLGAPNLIQELISDPPEFLDLLDFAPERVYLWMGGAGTIAQTHFDAEPNWFVQIVGQKRFLISPPQDWESFCPFPLLHSHDRQSQVNYSNPQESHCELFGQATVLEALLEPGDLLYLPAYWWHRVETISDSISVNAWDNRPDPLINALASIKIPLKALQNVDQAILFIVQVSLAMEQLEMIRSRFVCRTFHARYGNLRNQFKSCSSNSPSCTVESSQELFKDVLDLIDKFVQKAAEFSDKDDLERTGVVELIIGNYFEFTLGRIFGAEEVCSLLAGSCLCYSQYD
jgi:hypothetical protein